MKEFTFNDSHMTSEGFIEFMYETSRHYLHKSRGTWSVSRMMSGHFRIQLAADACVFWYYDTFDSEEDALASKVMQWAVGTKGLN